MKYYHKYPTCPNCHEPFTSGAEIETIDSQWYRCSGCECIFRKTLNFNDHSFENALELIPDSIREKYKNQLSNFPLLWAVKPNSVEMEYIDWLKSFHDKRNFLITWPWKTPKFIPILVNEYLNEFKTRNAIVLENMIPEKSKETRFPYPSYAESFRNMIGIADPRTDQISERVPKREMKILKPALMLKLQHVVERTAHISGCRIERLNMCNNAFTKCVKSTIKEYKELYGEESICRVTKKRLPKEKSKTLDERKEEVEILNEHGTVDLSFREDINYMGSIHYKTRWLWEILLHSDPIIRASFDISTMYYPDAEVTPGIDKSRLIFLNTEQNCRDIFRYLREKKPDLLIIPDVDALMNDILFKGEKSSELMKFLKDNSDTTVLMFSTDPDSRHIYHLNDYPTFKGCNVITHTVDNFGVLNCFGDKVPKEESVYPNPLSSRWDEIENKNNVPEITWVTVEGYDKLMEFQRNLPEIDYKALKDELVKFLIEIQTTLLNIRGAPSKYTVFKTRGKLLESLSYENILSHLRNYMSEVDIQRIEDLISSIFGSVDVMQNPLRDAVIKEIEKLLVNKKYNVLLVLRENELTGFNELLKDIPQFKSYGDRMKIMGWRELKDKERELKRVKGLVVVSTKYPPLGYKLNRTVMERFVFAGTKSFLQKIRLVVDNRINEYNSRPLLIPLEGEPVPEGLKSAMRSVADFPSDDMNYLISDLIIEGNSSGIQSSNEHNTTYNSHHSQIEAGNEVVLFIDMDNRGMFVPRDASITVIAEEGLNEINLKPIATVELEKKLQGTEILIDRGVHRSFRSIFISSMLNYSGRTRFQKYGIFWENFEELLDDAQFWINSLRRTVQRYSELHNSSVDEAEMAVAQSLSQIGLNARNPSYIRKWWSDFEVVSVKGENVRIYSIEHTKSINDITRIFAWINDQFPDFELKPEDGEKSYKASVFLQDIRRSFLLKRNGLNSNLAHLYRAMNRDIQNILNTLKSFKISMAKQLRISSSVEPFIVMEDYKKYVPDIVY